MKYIFLAVIVAVVAGYFILSQGWEECSFTEEYALERMMREMERTKLDKASLSKPSFNKEECSYNFLYKKGLQRISFIFTGWGEIHKWDHARDMESNP